MLVIDMQDRLLGAIAGRESVLARCARLARGAKALGLPIWGTEQNPSRLGPTSPQLAEFLPEPAGKMAFRATDCLPMSERLFATGPSHLTICGIETHVCVSQTVLDLLGRGFRVQVAADAVASRSSLDHDVALRRMERAGAVVTTTEAVLFEWVETADHPAFKAISALVKEAGPPRAEPQG